MESREGSRRFWPFAVTVSVLLHGAAVIALSALPGRQVAETRTVASAGPIPLSLVDFDPGEVSFEPAREPAPKPRQASSASEEASEPPTAALRSPLVGQAEILGLPSSDPLAGGAGQVGGADTTFFQVEARGKRIVYVVDGSASMGKNGALACACRELVQSIRRLPATSRFRVVIYNSRAHDLFPALPNWLEATPALVEEVAAALGRVVAEGRTDHEVALRKAFQLDPDVVFFLTDADDLTHEHLVLAARLNRGRAVVHTIEMSAIHRARTDMPLQVLARDNRGTYQAVDLER